MVDFKKLRDAKESPKLHCPRDIFRALPTPSGINDLYVSQAEVLEGWFLRRNEKDVVIKLHTGGGKTLVALLIAQSVMNEIKGPVLYLAPNNQLVEQVVKKGKEYGISTVCYKKKESLPSEFYNGKSVLVGAYETLFNGHSKFGVLGGNREITHVSAIILDDAHVALSSVRQAFTLNIKRKEHNDIYNELAGYFRPAFKEIQREGAFNDIIDGRDNSVIEVPSWAWNQEYPVIQQSFASSISKQPPHTFVWPFLRDKLGVCHCFFSKFEVSITPIFPLVDQLLTFENCERRIYMSATIADNSEIVRTFGASKKAVETPITSKSLTGIGERMILVPGLTKAKKEMNIEQHIKDLATHLATHKCGVVILSPSNTKAGNWTDIAKYPRNTEEVSKEVAKMQEKDSYGPLVLANRYDGIDLSNSSCRFLVIDDLPQGTTNYDIFRMNALADSAVSSLLASRLEQGLGRGSRGSGDYCVIILVGSKLVGWLGREQNLNFLTTSTRAQLEMGRSISQKVETPQSLDDTIWQCLNRNSEWVKYHASELAEATNNVTPTSGVALRVALEERKAFKQQSNGDYNKALKTLEQVKNSQDLQSNKQYQAWLAAAAARVAYQRKDLKKGDELQGKAFYLNTIYSPAKERHYSKIPDIPSTQSRNIFKLFQDHKTKEALIHAFQNDTSNLMPSASSNHYEEALCKLGKYLGFTASRPGKNDSDAPDVLWETGENFDFIIEAKNRKQEDTPLHKKDHAQLLQSEHWYKDKYPNREVVRVSVLPKSVVDSKVTATGTLACTLQNIQNITTALTGMLNEFIHLDLNKFSEQQCESALKKAKLKPEMIKDTFMKPFIDNKPRRGG